jgi:branched-chain amino acid transport system substrate-binding protein
MAPAVAAAARLATRPSQNEPVAAATAAQAWDTANLILSAAEKADVKDKDAFRAALKEADFDSVRGDFKFNTNNHPIQDIYVREVVKEDGVLTNKIVGTAFTDHGDAYAEQCKM